MKGLGGLLCASVATVLVAAGAAWASSPTEEKIAYTAAGQAKAKAEVLRRSDLPRGWAGGPRKPDVSSTEPCSYKPKQNDLVLMGAAETDWRKPGFQLSSEAQVLRTAAMMRRDWRRTLLAPQVLSCLRQGFEKTLGSGATFVSFGPVAFPHLASLTQAFRAVFGVKSGSTAVLVEIDIGARIRAQRAHPDPLGPGGRQGRAPRRGGTSRPAARGPHAALVRQLTPTRRRDSMSRFLLLLAAAAVAGAMYVAAAPGSPTSAGPTAAQFKALSKKVTVLQKQVKSLKKEADASLGIEALCILHQPAGVDQVGTSASGYLFGPPQTAPTAVSANATSALNLATEASPQHKFLQLNTSQQVCVQLAASSRALAAARYSVSAFAGNR